MELATKTLSGLNSSAFVVAGAGLRHSRFCSDFRGNHYDDEDGRAVIDCHGSGYWAVWSAHQAIFGEARYDVTDDVLKKRYPGCRIYRESTGCPGCEIFFQHQ